MNKKFYNHILDKQKQLEAVPPNETSSLLGLGRDSKESAERKGMLVKAALYAVQVFYSFFIM